MQLGEVAVCKGLDFHMNKEKDRVYTSAEGENETVTVLCGNFEHMNCIADHSDF